MIPPAKQFQIRTGQPSDAPELAHLHVEVWRETYRDLAPPDAYDTLGVNRRLPYWEAALTADHALTRVFVGGDATGIAGVVSLGLAREDALEAEAEIKHLYVRNRSQGTGLGRALLLHTFDFLKASGVASVALAVVEGNDKARQFYRRMGGTETERFTDAGPLWRSTNIAVRWTL